MSIEIEEVERIAALAHIRLSAEELPQMARDLSVVLDYINQLSTIDIDTGAARSDLPGSATPMRDDEPTASLKLEAVAANAPASAHGYFMVPRVIGGE